jgi:tellurite resistance protein
MAKLSDTGRDLMLRAMVSMAVADGDVDDIETATISAIFEKVTKDELGEAEITEAAKAWNTQDRDIMADLRGAGGNLSDFDAQAIVQAAYLVLLADGRVEAQEKKKLRDIAKALKMPEVELAAILEDLTD